MSRKSKVGKGDKEEPGDAKGMASAIDDLPVPAGDAQLLPSAAETIARIRDILTRARHQALQTVDAIAVRPIGRSGAKSWRKNSAEKNTPGMVPG